MRLAAPAHDSSLAQSSCRELPTALANDFHGLDGTERSVTSHSAGGIQTSSGRQRRGLRGLGRLSLVRGEHLRATHSGRHILRQCRSLSL
eukprot:1307285-Prymnesium_polylepis.1